MISWTNITGFGDTVVMMPVAAAILVWLLVGRAWKMAFWWAALFSLGLAIVAATKIAFIGWGIGIRSLDFTGFSGHAMRATAVMPVLFYLMMHRSRSTGRLIGIGLGLVFGIVLSVSRVEVHAHSISEAVAGCILGGVTSLGFIWLSRRWEKPALSRWLIAVSMIALFPTSYAKPAPTQRWMDSVALYLSGHDRPYTRGYWRTGPVEAKISHSIRESAHFSLLPQNYSNSYAVSQRNMTTAN
jgi:membrane-associated phospholipid phosphatase